jgi:hypothetical protein
MRRINWRNHIMDTACAIYGIKTEPQKLEYRTVGKVQKSDDYEVSEPFRIYFVCGCSLFGPR